MSALFGGEQVSELAPLAPNAGIDEVRDYLMRLHQWVRAREPVAAGDPLSKLVVRGELVEVGVLSYEPGEAGAGNANVSLSSGLAVISGSSTGTGADLEVVDASGAAVQMVAGQIMRCTNGSAVIATLPSIVGLKRGAVAGVYFTNTLTTNEVNRNAALIAGEAEHLIVNRTGWLLLFQFADAAEGWAVSLKRIAL